VRLSWDQVPGEATVEPFIYGDALCRAGETMSQNSGVYNSHVAPWKGLSSHVAATSRAAKWPAMFNVKLSTRLIRQ
jgi:hypothetical protein